MSKTLKTLMATMLVLTTGMLFSAPTAMAHFCEGVDPPTNCGECEVGDHDHNYADHSDYCESDIGFPGTSRCAGDIVNYRGLRVLEYVEDHVEINGPSPDGLCLSLERGDWLP